jgi:hypothetical protein
MGASSLRSPRAISPTFVQVLGWGQLTLLSATSRQVNVPSAPVKGMPANTRLSLVPHTPEPSPSRV